MYDLTMRRGIRRVLTGAILSVALTVTGAAMAGAAIFAPQADMVVAKLHDSIITAMKTGKTPQERLAVLDGVVRQSFDFNLMTKVAVGPSWDEATESDKTELIKAFTDLSVATYAARFKNFHNQRFINVDQAEGPKGTVWVKTSLVISDSETVKLNYLMRRDGAQWKIVDVYLDGKVSEMATRRSDYAQIVSQGGVKALTKALRDQTQELLTGTTE